jgi:mannosyltransferase OCH1-like enzyme
MKYLKILFIFLFLLLFIKYYHSQIWVFFKKSLLPVEWKNSPKYEYKILKSISKDYFKIHNETLIAKDKVSNEISLFQRNFQREIFSYCKKFNIVYITIRDNCEFTTPIIISSILCNFGYKYVIYLDDSFRYINRRGYSFATLNQREYSLKAHDQREYSLKAHDQREYSLKAHDQREYSLKAHDQREYFSFLIENAGDVDLILKKSCNTDIMIFRNSLWSLYKLFELNETKSISESLRNQIFTNYRSFHTIKSLPYFSTFITYYNSSSFNFLNRIEEIPKTYPFILPNSFQIHKTNNNNITQYQTGVQTQIIPKRIFQTMETNILSIEMIQTMNLWRKLNPDYNYYYFTSLECREFMKKHFGKNSKFKKYKIYEAYDKLIPGAYKADLWRYCVLYIYGGVYTDSRTIPLVPLTQIIDKDNEFVTAKDRLDFGLWQGFLCSKPNSLLLKSLIIKISKIIHESDYRKGTLDITGPMIINEVFQSFKNKINYKLLKHCPPYLTLYDKKLINTKNKINDALFSVLSGKEKYNISWLRKRVYKEFNN